MSRVLRGMEEVSLSVSCESSAVREEMLEVNFSGSRRGSGVGLEAAEPMLQVEGM